MLGGGRTEKVRKSNRPDANRTDSLRCGHPATLGNTVLEWLKQRWGDARAAETLRRALLEELRIYKDAADANFARSSKPELGGSFLIPVHESYPIYEANIEKLGHLQPNQVSAVVKAYAHLRAQVETLAAIGSFHRNEGPILHAVVDSKYGGILAANGKQLSEILAAALAALEGQSALPGASDPSSVAKPRASE